MYLLKTFFKIRSDFQHLLPQLFPLYGSFLRLFLAASDLSSQSVEVNNNTTVQFGGPKPLNSPSSNGDNRKLSLRSSWRLAVTATAPHFDLYIPDLLFFGEFTTKSLERSEIFQANAIVKLMEKVGVNKYSVVGTSYGGFVAYRLAEMWSERVEKVVIVS